MELIFSTSFFILVFQGFVFYMPTKFLQQIKNKKETLVLNPRKYEKQ